MQNCVARVHRELTTKRTIADIADGDRCLVQNDDYTGVSEVTGSRDLSGYCRYPTKRYRKHLE